MNVDEIRRRLRRRPRALEACAKRRCTSNRGTSCEAPRTPKNKYYISPESTKFSWEWSATLRSLFSPSPRAPVVCVNRRKKKKNCTLGRQALFDETARSHRHRKGKPIKFLVPRTSLVYVIPCTVHDEYRLCKTL